MLAWAYNDTLKGLQHHGHPECAMPAILSLVLLFTDAAVGGQGSILTTVCLPCRCMEELHRHLERDWGTKAKRGPQGSSKACRGSCCPK